MSFTVHSFRPQHSFATVKPPEKKKKNKWWWRLVFLALVALVFFILFNYVLPTVTVVIIPTTEERTKDFNVQLNVDKSRIDNNNNIFKAEIVQANEYKEEEFKATGSKNLGESATGQAMFTNRTGLPQPLTTDTDLIDDQGRIFRLQDSLTVPGAKVDEGGNVVPGEITAPIKAKEAGTTNNDATGRLNIASLPLDKQEKIYALISGNTTGGTDKLETVVSEDDLNNAQDKLAKELEPKVREKIKKQVSSDLVISEQLIIFDNTEITKQVEVDTKADNFKIALNLKAKTFAYDNKNLRKTLKEKLSQELQAGEVIAEEELGNLNLEVVQSNYDLGLADLKVTATFPVAESMDLEAIKQKILGQNESEARRYILSLPKVKDVRFVFALNLRAVVPTYANKVKVVLNNN